MYNRTSVNGRRHPKRRENPCLPSSRQAYQRLFPVVNVIRMVISSFLIRRVESPGSLKPDSYEMAAGIVGVADVPIAAVYMHHYTAGYVCRERTQSVS